MSSNSRRVALPLSSLALAMASLVGLGAAETVHGASTPIVVDTLSDNPTDGLTLREAIDEANANAGLDTIEFAAGLSGTIMLGGTVLGVSDSVEIRGPGSDVITIDASGVSRVINSSAFNTDLLIEGLTLRNGHATGIDGQGGAVRSVLARDVQLLDVVIADSSSNAGGGVHITAAQGEIALDGVRFEGNTATGPGGGGGLGITDHLGGISINESVFVDNVASSGSGGAMSVRSSMTSAPVGINASSVSDNEALDSAGIFVSVDLAPAFIVGSTVNGNSASTANGGVRIDATKVDIQRTTIAGNEAQERGAGFLLSDATTLDTVSILDNSATLTDGGIFLFEGEQMVKNSTVRGNSAPDIAGLRSINAASVDVIDTTIADTGGLGMLVTGAGDVTINRSTISGNGGSVLVGGVRVDTATSVTVSHSTISGNAGGVAGGLMAVDVSGEVRVLYSTVTQNSATSDTGGLFVDTVGAFDVSNSIVWGNTGSTAPDISSTGVDVNYSFIGDPTGATFNLGSGNNEIGVDPEIGSLADNGGPTLTHLPQPGSPVIGAGQPNLLFAPSVRDQRSRPRVVNGLDVGAVEVGASSTSIWTPVLPSRVADTRPAGETVDGVAEKGGKLAAGDQLRLPIAGRAGVPADAIGAIVNVTAVQPDELGFVTAHPCLGTLPLAASLNYTQGVNLGNEIVVGLDGGDACFFTSERAHLTVDVVGYVPAQSQYLALDPQRFVDTRSTGSTFDAMSQGGGPAGPGGTIETKIFDRGSVPPYYEAAMVYVTAVRPEGKGFATVHSCDAERPLASSLNHVNAVNRGNEIVVASGDNPFSNICVYTSEATEVTVDVVGAIPQGTNFDSLATPARLLDTRSAVATIDGQFQGGGKLGAGETYTLGVGGRAGLFAQPDTVILNVTSVAPEDSGFVTVYPCGAPQPLASSLNVVAGINGGNEVIAAPNEAGEVCIFVSVPMHLSVDATGSTTL